MHKYGKQTIFKNSTYVQTKQACAPFSTILPCDSTDGIEDYTYDLETCCFGLCPPRRKCAKPDKNQCYIGLSKKGEDPLLSIKWIGQAPFYDCTYDPTKVDTSEQIKKLRPPLDLSLIHI